VVLAGDIGGTKTLLQIAEFGGGTAPRVIREERYDSRAYDDLTPMLREFLNTDTGQQPAAACFGVAGPVAAEATTQHAKLTNLPWRLDSQNLSDALGIPARLINDFQAIGYGIEALEPYDLETLHEAEPREGAPRVVLGAGTGLGVALLFRHDDHYEAYPTEGGHADFAPTGEDQDALLTHLRGIHRRVSYERILSGPGLEAIYRFLLHREGGSQDPLLDEPDPPAAISRSALAGEDPRAARALDMFVEMYGTLAGNLALTCLARGGVYVAGGIAAKILPKLREGAFARAYLSKGRMSDLVASMPLRVVTDPKVGLKGAALAAARL
jgi:glucokinase